MLANYKKLENKEYSKERIELDLAKPSNDVLMRTTESTKRALEKAMNGKIKAASIIDRHPDKNSDALNIRYTPKQEGLTDNPDGHQRIIRITELKKDPFEQVKFKHKRIPRENTDTPVPVMHSPPRKITMSDQKDWKIPPCISNWKNAKGFTIPLEMRLSADGRNLRSYEINNKFSMFSDVLYITEKTARKEIEERNRLQESIKVMDTLKKEQELKEAAREAREKKLAMAVSNISSVNTTKTEETEYMLGNKRRISVDEEIQAEKEERDRWRNYKKREIQREKRIEAGGKRAKKEEERDISEKIALGQAQPTKKESMIDSRLYNQTIGLESGFADEEDYSLYDKPLFVDRTSAQLYKNVRAMSSIDNEGDSSNKVETRRIMEKIHMNKKNFEGTDLKKDYSGKPIEFELNSEEYGLNNIHKKTNNINYK